jgi:hypothetical protein
MRNLLEIIPQIDRFGLNKKNAYTTEVCQSGANQKTSFEFTVVVGYGVFT